MITTDKTSEGCKYHECYQFETQIVAQQNREGRWHGYIGQIFTETFKDETEAVKWVKAHEMTSKQ